MYYPCSGTDSYQLQLPKEELKRFLHLSGIPLIDPMPLFVKVEKRMSFPSPLLMYRSNQINRQKHSERIVFILVSPKIMTNIADGFVYNQGDTEYISDHFPVAIDMLIDKRSKLTK